jgi:predicted flavoprotein YhiN
VKELLIGNNVEISLDLYPEKSVEYIDQHLMTTLSQNNKVIKNGLLESLQLISLGHVTAPIIDAILLNANIDENLISNSLARVARQRLVYVLKGLNIKVTGTLGKDKAIVTSGGVPLSEVDTRYMRSRLYNNLYIVGDMLDIDRPSGGYSLQLCWTTGFVAGVSAAE